MTERRACRLANQPRGTQRYRAIRREGEDALTQAIILLASQYGRYGYRRITALLKRAGWQVGKDRVERIWRREGLKVPQKQKPRGRRWLNDGSCVRLRPERRNHVWSYDFVSTRTHDGRSVRLLNLIDEHTRESLLVRAERHWSSSRVISALADVMVMKGVPEHLRSDNGPEFVAKDRQIAVLVPALVVRHWWQAPLHNQRAQLLKLLLLVRGNQRIMVINTLGIYSKSIQNATIGTFAKVEAGVEQ